MYLLVVIATWLVITANGYTFQKPVRPSIVHYPMPSHPNSNTGGYGGQQSWTSGGVNGHPVAGTRGLQTPRHPIAPGVRSYLPKQSYVPVPQSFPKTPVAAGPRAYQVQHGTQGPVNTKRPYGPKVSAVIKPMAPKISEKMVDSSKGYPSGPATASHSPAINYSPAVKPVPAETSHHQSTGSLVTNLQPQRWIPSYGTDVNKAVPKPSYPSISTSATGGNPKQWAKQSTGTGQVFKMKTTKAKETAHDSSSTLHEVPLQTAVLIIRKPSPKIQATPNRQNSNVPAIIPDTTPYSILANAFPFHKSPTITEPVSTNPSALVESKPSDYQNPTTNIPLTSPRPDSLPSSPLTTYPDGLPRLTPENEILQRNVPVGHELPEHLASTEASVPQFPQLINPESNGGYVLQPVSPPSDSIVPVNDDSSITESQGVNYKSHSSDQQLISDTAVAYQLPQQSAYSVSINLQSMEEIPPQVVETKEASFSEPSYLAQDAQQPPVEETSTFHKSLSPPFASFDDSAIPKYVLGPYPSLVLPEPPLELANSAYGVTPLGVDESHPILSSRQTDSTPTVGSYGVPAVSPDNTQHLSLQQQWGYYSAEPFHSTSSDIGQVNVLPSSVNGGYQQSVSPPEVNNQQSSYSFPQPSPSQQQSGYPSSQQSTAESNNHYQTSRQTVATEAGNNYQAATNHWSSSNSAHNEGRQRSMGSDKTSVAILSAANVFNQDGSFSYNYETEDDIKVEASGYQKQLGADPEDSGTVAKGSYSYTAPDGVKISVTWVADENGFQPIGDHIPTPPSFPIDRVIAHLSASKKTGENVVPAGWVQSAHAY